MSTIQPVTVHVEVCLLPSGVCEEQAIRDEVARLLHTSCPVYREGLIDFRSNALLTNCVESIDIVDLDVVQCGAGRSVSFWRGELKVHVFQLSDEGAEQELLEGAADGEEVNACDQWLLPARALRGLWNSLCLEPHVKGELLSYAETAMLFADQRVRPEVISWNRVVLLHGPPGTGKTTLCKALAHKLSIRLADRYRCGQLIEVNAHSLFSKWFSESGKLVQRLFDHIAELADDDDSLVCILIDEVESLTAARSAAFNGGEPSDAVRVVNAVLTQLDRLRSRNNVLVMATSNVSKALDVAFLDRADIKLYMGLPPTRARYDILRSCMHELMRVGIVDRAELAPYERLGVAGGAGTAAAFPPLPPRSPPAAAAAVTATPCASENEHGGRALVGTGVGIAGDGMETWSSSPPPKEWAASAYGGSGAAKAGAFSLGGIAGGAAAGVAAAEAAAVADPGAAVHAQALLSVAEAAEGLSGRALRKLPFQAHAFFVQRQSCSCGEFVAALAQAVEREQTSRQALGRLDC